MNYLQIDLFYYVPTYSKAEKTKSIFNFALHKRDPDLQ